MAMQVRGEINSYLTSYYNLDIAGVQSLPLSHIYMQIKPYII